MIVYFPLLVAVIGVLLYALATNGKIQEIGRISFGCGLLAFLFQIGNHSVNLLR